MGILRYFSVSFSVSSISVNVKQLKINWYAYWKSWSKISKRHFAGKVLMIFSISHYYPNNYIFVKACLTANGYFIFPAFSVNTEYVENFKTTWFSSFNYSLSAVWLVTVDFMGQHVLHTTLYRTTGSLKCLIWGYFTEWLHQTMTIQSQRLDALSVLENRSMFWRIQNYSPRALYCLNAMKWSYMYSRK